ncbi:sushi, von Willebrand factor type A, EGF and pentraxin domain-containing protein 1-like isoform X3 [Limanda limanda]|uniref:sushi, von Willebrand factor type A, EGF and pentraxin domain-containing protein 1-like isoform X3 n=1 Tax=Limanda limanda TaxID=27771 RepID=UPI0029C90B47|nr:sushi, von Willebrand factor type A, EGF and pentraxin domain-containing protein 1-like isoform X3 [Limanda limanda]
MHVITRSCVLLFWMQTLTFVKSQDLPKGCTLQNFRNGPLFDSNFDTTGLEAEYPAGKTIRVSCSVGFSGFFKLSCVEGKWEKKGTICQPRSCGHPGDAPFADFQLSVGDDFVFGSQVLYTCHKGYQMVSRISHRRCMSEGWDGVVPTCEAQQCPVINVATNLQVIGDPEEANFGNVVRFSCKIRSEVLIGLQELHCDEKGEWSGEAPICKAITCLVPVIENGRVPGNIQEYQEHDFLRFQCNAGFKPSEERASKCTKLGLRAGWSPAPECKLITCKLQLPSLYGTEYDPSYKSEFSPGETVSVTCGQRHWISDKLQRSAVVSCKEDGQWSLRPICQEVTCSNQRDRHVSWWDVSWGQQLKLWDDVRYSCKSGYKKTGAAPSARCTREGWKPDPLCQAITCDREDVANADIINPQDKYRYGGQANYVCKDGYEGRFDRTCGTNGWSGASQCREKGCKKQDISEAHINHNVRHSYSHGDRVQYVCNEGDQRPFTIVCEKGVWTGIQSCTDCPKAEVSNGFFAGPYGGKLYYTCDEGYKLVTSGWWAEAECHDRLWSGLYRCIEKNACGEVPEISNREVSSLPLRSHHADGQSVRIICKEGFASKVESLTCDAGIWTPEGLSLTTICAPVAKSCSPPPKVQNAVVDGMYQREFLSGSDVTYQCRATHQMEGDGKIRCDDGNWEVRNIVCALISCPVPEIENGRASEDVQEYKEHDFLRFQCNPGFKPSEDTPSKCTKKLGLRAGWSPAPECKPITCTLELPSLDGTEYDPSSKSEFSHGDTVTVTCGQSHWISDQLKTSAVVSCKEDGQWSLRPVCQEVTCSNLKDPDVSWWGVSRGQQPKLGDDVEYRCKSGYRSTGRATSARCTREGWKPDPLCQAITCLVPVIENGRVPGNIQEYKEHEILRFQCNPGFQPSEDRPSKCTKLGLRSGWSPPPECEPINCTLELPSLHGTEYDPATKSEFSPGETVSVTCGQSHWISDQTSAVVSCKEDGQWSLRPVCQEVTCSNQQDQHVSWWGVYQGQQMKLQDEVRFRCIQGYKKTGGATRATCTREGWKPDPLCQAITCDRDDITNADIINPRDKYRINDRANYVCKDGYEGRFYRTCGENGWSETSQCREKGCKKQDISEAHIDHNVRDSYSHGDRVQYVCNEGDQRPFTIVCEKGVWTGIQSCTEVTCSNQKDPLVDWWAVSRGQQMKLGDEVRYSCKSDYEKTGRATSARCTREGWKPDPLCQVISCLVPVIENGRVPGNIQEYQEHDILRFQCNPGFQPSEDRPSKCTKLGLRAEWSPAPECKQITCKLQLPPLYGTEYDPSSKSEFSHGDTVNVTCGQRHWIYDKLKTSAVVSCKEDGQWSFRPVCQEVTCSNRRDQHVSWWGVYRGQQPKLWDEFRYGCIQDYKKTGDDRTSARCTREGWKPDPLCQAITCDRDDIANADIINPRDKYRMNDRANYVCKDGYEGRFDRTCRENGWSGPSQCIEKGCKKQDISEAHIDHNVRDSYSHGDRVQYVCNEGDQRPFTIVCEKGVWTGIQSCTDCPKAEVPHGFFAGPYGGKLYYTCDEGYKLVTSGWWAEAECHDRLWSGLYRCIENTTCGEVPEISNREVSSLRLRSHHADGESVRIICKKGFASKVESLTCHAGEWTSEGLSLTTICAPVAKSCSPPPKVQNAVVDGMYQSEFLSGSDVTYQCRATHQMEGDGKSRCNEGNWEVHNIVCALISCPVPVIENGRASEDVQDYKEHDILRFQCNPGFQPSEDRPSKCTKLGLRAGWSPAPECKQITCKLELPPLYGTEYDPSSKSEFSHGDTVNVTCGQRHWISDQLQTSAVVSCKEDGQWSLRPVCQEVTCSNRRQQHVSWWGVYWGQQLKLWDEVRYGCIQGYKKAGDATRATCTREGWKPDPLCQAITCDRDDIANADIINPQDKYRIDDQANYICKDGYEGEFYRTCGENGWSGTSQCREVTCSNQRQQHVSWWGVYWGQQLKLWDEVRYGCIQGYKKTGDATRATCTREGWKPDPLCQAITCDRDDIANADIINPQDKYRIDDQANYVCKDGYEGEFYRTCGENGWSGTSQCRAIICLAPVIENGRVPGNIQEYKEHDFLHFQCNPGFQPSEDSPSRCTKLGLRAGWSPPPECKPITCKLQLLSLEGTEYDPSSKSEFSPGDTVTVTCGQSHWISDHLQASAVVSCKEDGQWSFRPVCQEVTCSNRRQQHVSWWGVYRGQQKKLGDEVRYSCKSGYKKTGGAPSARCTREGWKPDPLCQAITCDRDDITNADIINPQDKYRKGCQANYVCKDGYEGEFYRTCGENGWSGTSQCRVISCPVPVIENGRASEDVQHYKEHDILRFQCNPGFQPSEDRPSKCTKLGLRAGWSPAPECKQITCKLELPPLYGTEYDPSSKSEFSPGDTVNVTCGQSHWISDQLQTSAVVSCKEDGQWSLRPVCQEVTCSNQKDPHVSWWDVYRGQQKKLGDDVGYGCKSGYKKTGGDTRATCNREGWKPDPLCQDITCEVGEMHPSLRADGLSSGNKTLKMGHKLKFHCDDDFSLDGAGQIECLKTGQWDAHFPTCSDKCKFTGDPANMIVRAPGSRHRLAQGEKLTFSCRLTSQTLRGKSEVTCLANGQWSDPFPTCGAPVGCERPPPLENGDTKNSVKFNYRHNDQVEYICQAYHIIEGGPFQTCKNGEWTREIRCLKPCTVDEEATRTHNIAFRFSGKGQIFSIHDDSIEFYCTRGRTVGSVGMRQMCVDGVLHLPSCQ